MIEDFWLYYSCNVFLCVCVFFLFLFLHSYTSPIGREYRNLDEVYEALLSREVDGALIDALIAGSREDLFNSSGLRIYQTFQHSSVYGMVLAGETKKLQECFENFMKENSAMISAHVASKTSVIKVEGLLPLTWDLRNSHETFWWFWLISYAIGRKLSTRLTEHKRVTRNGDVNNHICEHHLQTKHQIDLDSATYIMYPTDYYQRTHFRKLVQTPLNLFKFHS